MLALYSDFLFFKQKTAYEMHISDWSSDVCSSDLAVQQLRHVRDGAGHGAERAVDRGPAGIDPAAAHQPGRRPHPGDAIPDRGPADRGEALLAQIGRASCRERVCQSV